MATTEATAGTVIERIREMLGSPDGDVDIVAAVRRVLDDEVSAHDDWREAVARLERAENEFRILMSPAVALIANERRRQVDREGWTPAHDDNYCDSELVRAAICYAQSGSGFSYGLACNHAELWPWEPSWFKPHDRVRDLTRAGALITAEIDRLLREQAQSPAAREAEAVPDPGISSRAIPTVNDGETKK